MNFLSQYRATLGLAMVTGLCLSTATTRAELVMTLAGTPGSSIVNVTFSGSATATADFVAGVSGIGWSLDPNVFNPFPPAITGGDFGIFQLSGSTAKLTVEGDTSDLTYVFLQDSSNSPVSGAERFGADGTGNPYVPFIGQQFSWSGSGTIDLSGKGLTFDDLTPGDSGIVSKSLGGIPGRLVVVPEPATGLAFLGLAVVVPFLRRRRD